MDRSRYFFEVAWYWAMLLLIGGCVGKRPEDDVALIKQLLAKFERGVNQRSEIVLDSIMIKRKLNLSSRLLEGLSSGRKLEGSRIAKKSFVIVKDSAEVTLRLSLRYAPGGEQPEQIEKPLKLWLRKKRGKWKVHDFEILSDER